MESYAKFILQEANCYFFPIDLEKIIQHFNLKISEKPLPSMRGFLTEELRIFVEQDDTNQVKKFTIAHELVEILVNAIVKVRPIWVDKSTNITLRENDSTKEMWCNRGAADILMPMDIFQTQIKRMGITLATAQHLAKLNGVSLISTLRRIVETNLESMAIIEWQFANKPSELSSPNQLSLPGFLSDVRKKLRVHRRFASDNFPTHIPEHKSAPENSSIYEAYNQSQRNIIVKSEYLYLKNSDKQIYYVESMRYWKDTVISLIRII